ncbi:MAG: DUF4080 domain-containing protein [Defluviitaleaceae bacterium]|nr:DUF4080 domain-containing protein [Defluviitaleaceae bacterium]
MSKVVLLAINSKYVHSALSVWVLAKGISEYAHKAHDVEIIEATIHQQDSEISAAIATHKPDVVGISTYIWNAAKLPGLLKLLKEQLPNCIFVLGGPEASYNADYWLASGADYVIHGEGERQLPVFLDALGDKNTGNHIHESTLTEQCNPLDPYNATYISTLKNRLAYLETSRGCPYSCAFCLSGESKLIFFPIQTAKEQLCKLSKSGARTIKLIDRTFNINPQRAYQLFEYVISLDTSCCFHFEVAADLFDERTLMLLNTAPPGRIQFEAGLQSYHEPTLKAVSRKADLTKAEQNIKTLLVPGNIHIHVDLIAGLPHETLAIFKDSFDRAYKLGAHDLQLGFLKLLHGSSLRKQAGELGILYQESPPYEIISSSWLSVSDIRTLKQTENALRHTHNKGRFLSTIKYVLFQSADNKLKLRPFTLFHKLGEYCENHGLPLEDYAKKIHDCFLTIPGIDKDALESCMICDWLAMVRGKNMPGFLRKPDTKRKQTISAIEKKIGRTIGREEVAFLPSGKAVFVDVNDRDVVTGLYKLYPNPV